MSAPESPRSGERRGSFPWKPSLDWLLVLVPAALAAKFLAPEHPTALFLLACGAIVPLAGLMGRATEQLADRVGEGAGGCSTPPSATLPSSSSPSRLSRRGSERW